MVTVRHIAHGHVHVVEASQAARLAAAGEGVVWIDLVGDDPRVRRALSDMGIDEWMAEDMLQTATHPKAEARPDMLFLVVCGLDLDAEGDRFELSTMELDAVLGGNWLVTHAERELEVTTTAATLLERDVGLGETSADLLHLLLDTMVDEYEPFIDDFIPDRIDEIEDRLFTGQISPEVRREIYLRRRDVQRLQRVAGPQAEAVRRLATMTGKVAEGRQHLFTDIADRLAYVAAQTESLRTQLDTAFEHYQTLVANQQNEIMKVLTMVSAMLLPLTVVTGVYGMNFDFMPELRERWGYPAVLLLMLAISISSLMFFHYKGWLGRRRGRTAAVGRTLQVGVGRVLRTPAIGARVVGRTAGRIITGPPPEAPPAMSSEHQP